MSTSSFSSVNEICLSKFSVSAEEKKTTHAWFAQILAEFIKHLDPDPELDLRTKDPRTLEEAKGDGFYFFGIRSANAWRDSIS